MTAPSRNGPARGARRGAWRLSRSPTPVTRRRPTTARATPDRDSTDRAPLADREAASCSAKSDWASWRLETFAIRPRGGRSGYRSLQIRDWRQTSSITQRPTGTISPVSSSAGRNSSGRTRPRLGSSQRMSASTPTRRLGPQRHDRLVVETELALLERQPQPALGGRRRQALTHRTVEGGERAAAARMELGLVHRGVRVADDVFGIGVGSVGQRDPDARRDADAVLAHLERGLDHLDQARRDPLGHLDGRDVVEHQHELVAGVAYDAVLLLDRGAQPVRDRPASSGRPLRDRRCRSPS